ncbi:bifunctional RecB family nuclease/DEAD/DEAH box helicase [Nocardia yamanashiensis]|uniref:bifunctional RecB family nuclease/DEAD/DEAH box helicase n=1 Tax=Nocardia yamanashiensis TaxID=209247 RepID=UPI0038CD75E9
MILFGDRVVCSTGDLVSAARCEFALLRALDAELGLVPPVERSSSGADAHPESNAIALSPLSDPAAGTRSSLADPAPVTQSVLDAPAVGVAAPLGFPAGGDGVGRFGNADAGVAVRWSGGGAGTWERVGGAELSAAEQLLAELRDRHGDGVVRVGVRAVGDASKMLAALRDAHAATLGALAAGVEAVAGAVVLDGAFAAHSDFLLRDSAPEAYDYVAGGVTRRRGEIAALLAAAGCVDALQRNGLRAASHARIWVDGVAGVHSLADISVVYRARRQRLESIVEAKLGELLPVQWGDRRFLACGRCDACTAELEARRDLLLVAGMRPATRAQLRDAGITTVERLAAADATVTGIPGPAFTPLRRQAELQILREETGQPAHTLIDAAALAALPRPNAGDLFASSATPDVITLLTNAAAPGADTAEEHDPDDAMHLRFTFALPGGPGRESTESTGAQGVYLRDGTGIPLLDFLAGWQREFPHMRIHHYRGGLRPVLSTQGEQDPDGEDTVAELLPALVDLYPIVRSALIVGERSYALMALPPNREAGGDEPEAVLRLRDWLLQLAREHEVTPARRWLYDYAQTGPDELEAALREFADSARDHDAAQVAAAFTAAALGYHRRERQPLRWAHEDRLDHPIEEWADTPGVLIADWGTVDTKWHSTGTRLMRRYLTLTGRLGTGNAPPPGTPVLTLYDRPVPGMTAEPGRRATAYATVLGCSLDTNFEDVVRVVELLPDGCEPYDELPTAIAPCPPGRDEQLEAALEDTAHQLLVTLPNVPETAVFDLLSRRPPRLRTGAALPEVFGDHAAAVTAAVLDLANSYVAVQGPPGTGKTDTTARVVERLVTRYKWRVGVVARSHQVVEHVLDAVVQVGVLPELVAKADAQAVAPEWLPIEADRYERFLDNAVNGCVVGGLPGDFTDASHIPRDNLDLLVIADAGKFPLADAVAVGISARNLLLVGDPAPAASLGAHAEPIAESVLGRIVGAHRTLPAAYGYFLDRTWRMHPRMSGPVSRLRYDNRLRSNETVTLARELEGITPGVRTVPVEHHGNSTESAEEAREIVRQVRTLLGLSWHTGAVTRRLHPHDILVVAPYHAQVARIRTLLSRARIEDVLVGTADHFQGREAAVVLVSMTTSAPKDAPHGVGKLLSRHWLTSAISRAMWAAIIVRSPLLTEYLPATATELSDLAAVLQLDRV